MGARYKAVNALREPEAALRKLRQVTELLCSSSVARLLQGGREGLMMQEPPSLALSFPSAGYWHV